jgi:hypothetical protein
MLVTVHFETAFHTEFTDIFKFYLHTKFHVSNSNDLLDIITELTTEYWSHAAAILLSSVE